MTDYKKAADRVREILSHIYPETDHDLDVATVLCELAAKADAEIDPVEEAQHCLRASESLTCTYTNTVEGVARKLLSEREAARLQATLVAHKAYRELTEALAEFFYCHDPDDLKRVERAYEKVKGL